MVHKHHSGLNKESEHHLHITEILQSGGRCENIQQAYYLYLFKRNKNIKYSDSLLEFLANESKF